MVRIEINHIGRRNIIACCRFSASYPCSPLLFELKSKTLSGDLLQKLTNAAENEGKKFIGKPQILSTIKFLKNFLIENPLSVCYDELTNVRKLLTERDELKLKQKLSAVHLALAEGGYFFKFKINVPPNYFISPAHVSDAESNLPGVMERFLLAQSHVIGIQCSEPPATRLVRFKGGKERAVGGKIIKVPPAGPTNFQPTPSLEKIIGFLVRTFRGFVLERCQVCNLKCLPDDPEMAEKDEQADNHVERVYCGHLFHLSCLIKYMKTPPFHGGKRCGTCGEVISHEKWKLSEKQAEDRWAHEQARERELKEIADFFV